MKKYVRLLITIFTIVLLSGCVKENIKMSINKDKSVVIETKLLISDKMFSDDSQKSSFVSQAKDLEKKGYTVTQTTENGYSGFIVSKKFKNIDNLSNNNGEKISLGDILNEDFDTSKLFKVKKSFLKNTYSASFEFEFDQSDYDSFGSDEDSEDDLSLNNTNSIVTTQAVENSNEEETNLLDDNELGDLVGLAGEMEFKYIVNLPYKVISSNASSVSDNKRVLTWNLQSQGTTNIEYTFDMYNISVVYIGGCALLLIILIIIIIIVIKKKKAGKETLIHADYDPSIAGQITETIPTTMNNFELNNQVQVPTNPQIQTPQPVQNNDQNNASV